MTRLGPKVGIKVMMIMNPLSFTLAASFAAATCTALSSKVPIKALPNTSTSSSPQNYHLSSRRSWFTKSIISTASATATITFLNYDVSSSNHHPPSAVAADYVGNNAALPDDLKQFTALAPLGVPTSTGSKLTGLSLSELASRLSHDLVEGSNGEGGYFISGDISTQLFRDDCTFVDPTNSVSSLSRYQNALKILFDPERSYVQLVEPLTIDENKKQITARIRSGGVLQLPWSPRISSYESLIVYTIDDNSLVERQDQVWSISAFEALKETFTPLSFSAPSDS